MLEKVLVATDGTPAQSSLKITGKCNQTLREARLELALGVCGVEGTVPSASSCLSCHCISFLLSHCRPGPYRLSAKRSIIT